MVNGTLIRPFHGLEQQIMEYLCEAKRTPGQVVDHLVTGQPGFLETLNRLIWEGWIVPVKRAFWSGAIPEWTWRNMDEKPSYKWRLERRLIVGHHRFDRLYIGPIWDVYQFAEELARVRDNVTFWDNRRLCYTLGDEMAVIKLYEQRFGEFDPMVIYRAPARRKRPHQQSGAFPTVASKRIM